MRKRYILLVIVTLLIATVSKGQTKVKNKELEEFVTDLSSSNNKLRGKLMLFGPFKDDLSNLTYEQYLQFLKENESVSDKGLSESIRRADQHLFISKKNSFLIAIYSQELNAVLYDDSNSAHTDSIKQLKANEAVPNLKEFISKTSLSPQ